MSNQRTAFVLSGGASLGSIQVGMLEALYERGIRPDLIVGTSAGALNGAYLASRPQTVATARELGEIWRGLRRNQVFPVNPFTGLLGFLGARSHLVPDSGLRSLVTEHTDVERIEDSPVELHLIATDAQTGEEVRLSRGSLVDAVMASSAIPGVLPAIERNGRTLIDGGVSNNAPISHAVELGASEIYVLAVGAACELAEPPKSALAMLVQASSLLVGHRLAGDIAEFSTRANLVVLPAPCPIDVQPTDFGRADELIGRARDDARRVLARRERGECGAPHARSRSLIRTPTIPLSGAS
jgi:NTE family protein